MTAHHRSNNDQDFSNKAFALKATFQKNMLEMMSENLQLSFVQQSKKNIKNTDFKEIEAKALDRWRGIICFLLNIDTMNDVEESLRRKQRDTYYELLTNAEYMEKHQQRQQYSNALTATGFSFIL